MLDITTDIADQGWHQLFSSLSEEGYVKEILQFLKSEKEHGKVIYPPEEQILQAFKKTGLQDVKVVLIGQDPYHSEGEAMGLSFSVPRGKRVPPSLLNVYKEIERDLGIDRPTHGDLTYWAEQGVLLLNAILTVEHKQAGSHRKVGWLTFTDKIITHLSEERKGLIFLLWGNFAKKKSALIDTTKHTILEAAHPSPLARNAFNNCKHFSKVNTILRQQGQSEIDWQIR